MYSNGDGDAAAAVRCAHTLTLCDSYLPVLELEFRNCF